MANERPTAVRVICRIGETTFARASADVFDDDVLTISWMDGRVAEQYPSDRWRSAAVYDADGYPLYELHNPHFSLTVRPFCRREMVSR